MCSGSILAAGTAADIFINEPFCPTFKLLLKLDSQFHSSLHQATKPTTNNNKKGNWAEEKKFIVWNQGCKIKTSSLMLNTKLEKSSY